MKITLNGKEIDLDKALPLQLRDLRRLKKEFDLAPGEGSGDIEKQAGFFLVILQKANKDITAEDVDDLTLVQMGDLSKTVAEASVAADVPSSASSTS